MAKSFAYTTSVRNLPSILGKIRAAGTPPKFTLDFLRQNLGYGSSTDRAVIPVLKSLGFLGADGTPTARYNEYRDESRSGRAIATGLREGWADIFLSDQKAHERSSSELVELFKSVSGANEGVAQKMATTFKALTAAADWTAESGVTQTGALDQTEDLNKGTGISPGVTLHHDIHLHLPPTSDVSVYTAIFRALRSELLD